MVNKLPDPTVFFLEEVFGKEQIAKVAVGVKYYKFPQDRGQDTGPGNLFLF
jgi:hypothetical protein